MHKMISIIWYILLFIINIFPEISETKLLLLINKHEYFYEYIFKLKIFISIVLISEMLFLDDHDEFFWIIMIGIIITHINYI